MNHHRLGTWCRVLAVAGSLFFVLANANTIAQSPLIVQVAVDLADTVGVPSVASGVNDLGAVVGTRSPYGLEIAYSWSDASGATDLGFGTALAVNNRGDVTGHSLWSSTVPHARLWSDGGEQDVAYGIAYSLNDRVAVVGFHYPPNTIYHAFRWTALDGLQDVESLTGATPPWSYFAPHSEARFIRNDGVMAGWRGGQAVVWQPTGELSALGPGVAMSINDSGLVVGATALAPAGRPVVWKDGVAIQLSGAPGEAEDVNASGYVVGWQTIDGERHAFVWHAASGLQDLGAGEARSLNDAGRVAGYLATAEGHRATVWQIQLPAADALVGFEAMARRLLADADPKDTRSIVRNVRLAIKAFGRAPFPVVRRHLDRALAEVSTMRSAGQLAPATADALLAFGQSIGAGL